MRSGLRTYPKRFIAVLAAGLFLLTTSCFTIYSMHSFLSRTINGAPSTQLSFQTSSIYDIGTPVNDNVARHENHQCLQSNEEVDEMIRNAKQIIIAFPAKAAGTTMKDFVIDCTNRNLTDNLLNFEDVVIDELMKGESHLSMPKIIASHVYTDEPLRKLIQQLPRSALLIYIHREESTRLLSAVKMMYSKRTPRLGGDHIRENYCDVLYNKTSNACIVTEEALFSMIKNKGGEIGIGESQLLTCDTYDAIQINAPNMIFANYKQAGRLQRLLAKYHCPNLLEKDVVEANVEKVKGMTETKKVRINSSSGGDDGHFKDVDLVTWLEEKSEMLQFAFGLRDNRGCQSKTRKMEDAMFACDTEIVHI